MATASLGLEGRAVFRIVNLPSNQPSSPDLGIETTVGFVTIELEYKEVARLVNLAIGQVLTVEDIRAAISIRQVAELNGSLKEGGSR